MINIKSNVITVMYAYCTR